MKISAGVADVKEFMRRVDKVKAESVVAVVPQRLADMSNGAGIIAMLDPLFDELFLVGGAVRDEILGFATRDLDFVTPLSPAEVVKTLKQAGLTARENAIGFGTVAVAIGEFDIQITTYRTETYQNSDRRPNVVYAADIDTDLARRDFTMNSIAVSRNERVDPYNGLKDIEHKIIRVVGDADLKFQEDPLRMLRAFRFSSVLGFDIDTEIYNAISRQGGRIRFLSQERIAEELRKLLKGDYWTDALYEAAEAGVLSACFRNFGFAAPIRPGSVLKVLEQYKNSELFEMTFTQRWATVFDVLSDAEKGEGVKTLDVTSLVDRLASYLLIKKETIQGIHSELARRTSSGQERTISRTELLEAEYSALLADRDPRAVIVESRLLYERGREAFNERSYRVAAGYFTDALKLNDRDIDYIIANYADEDKERKIKAVKRYYVDRYSYLLSSQMLMDNIQLKFDTGDDAVQYYVKNAKGAARLNSREIEVAVVVAIVRAYRNIQHGFTEQPYLDFLKAYQSYLDTDHYDFLVKLELHRRLQSSQITPSERIETYAWLAEHAREKASDGIKDLSYYDPQLDMRLWQALMTDKLTSFWSAYQRLEVDTDEYIDYAESVHRTKVAYRRAYLNAASALTHGLSLAKKLEDKIYITRAIVASHTMAGYSSSKSVLRFRVLLDWLCFVSDLLELKKIDAKKILSLLDMRRSLNYVDIDEVYFNEQLSDIARARNHLNDVLQCVKAVSGEELRDIGSPELQSIALLVKSRLIDSKEGLVVLKNFCMQQVLDTYERIPFMAEPITEAATELSEVEKLAKMVESDTLEFKAGWAYSLHTGQRDRDISVAITKTISAFMNTHGGTILIGVSDGGSIDGLEMTDFQLDKKSHPRKIIDGIKKNIDDIFDSIVGTQHAPMKSIAVEYVGDERAGVRTVLMIKVKASPTPVYVRVGTTEEFFVRGDASTRQLHGSKMVSYVGTHFLSSNERFIGVSN